LGFREFLGISEQGFRALNVSVDAGVRQVQIWIKIEYRIRHGGHWNAMEFFGVGRIEFHQEWLLEFNRRGGFSLTRRPTTEPVPHGVTGSFTLDFDAVPDESSGFGQSRWAQTIVSLTQTRNDAGGSQTFNVTTPDAPYVGVEMSGTDNIPPIISQDGMQLQMKVNLVSGPISRTQRIDGIVPRRVTWH
jgi:hypothetical protein